jgi:hypothetical protein
MAKGKDIEVEVAEVVDFMRLTGKFAPALQQVVTRKITVQAAKEAGIKVSTNELQKAADNFRLVNGLAKASDTESWLNESGVSLEFLENFLETNLYINKFKAHLEKKAPKNKYLSSPQIQESISEMIYQDWLSKAL